MKRVASTKNLGRSAFNAELMYSYSLLAISKSCSSYTRDERYALCI